jgi:hemerythrin superfamily protein
MNDHDVIKTLMNDVVSAPENSTRRGAFEQLKAALVVHNATEENLVYPAIRAVAHKKMESQTLYNDTAEADVLVFELDAKLNEGDDSGFLTKAKKLQKAILAHIDEEERTAFPQLEKTSDVAHTEALTAAVREFRKTFHFDPKTA